MNQDLWGWMSEGDQVEIEHLGDGLYAVKMQVRGARLRIQSRNISTGVAQIASYVAKLRGQAGSDRIPQLASDTGQTPI